MRVTDSLPRRRPADPLPGLSVAARDLDRQPPLAPATPAELLAQTDVVVLRVAALERDVLFDGGVRPEAVETVASALSELQDALAATAGVRLLPGDVAELRLARNGIAQALLVTLDLVRVLEQR